MVRKNKFSDSECRLYPAFTTLFSCFYISANYCAGNWLNLRNLWNLRNLRKITWFCELSLGLVGGPPEWTATVAEKLSAEYSCCAVDCGFTIGIRPGIFVQNQGISANCPEPNNSWILLDFSSRQFAEILWFYGKVYTRALKAGLQATAQCEYSKDTTSGAAKVHWRPLTGGSCATPQNHYIFRKFRKFSEY